MRMILLKKKVLHLNPSIVFFFFIYLFYVINWSNKYLRLISLQESLNFTSITRWFLKIVYNKIRELISYMICWSSSSLASFHNFEFFKGRASSALLHVPCGAHLEPHLNGPKHKDPLIVTGPKIWHPSKYYGPLGWLYTDCGWWTLVDL